MTIINTYLTFDGNCEEAFNFYQSVFNKKFSNLSKFKDMPENPQFPISESEKEKIMHVSLPISEETVLMGSDTGGEWSAHYKQGNNFSISISADSKEEADRLFSELSKDGKITMPINKTFWDSYFGSLIDKYGINWMVGFDSPDRKK